MQNLLVCAVFLSGLFFGLFSYSPNAHAADYSVQISVRFDPGTSAADVRLRVKQKERSLKQLNFVAPKDLFPNFKATGGAPIRRGDRIVWEPPAGSSTISWRAVITAPKGDGYDALITEDWALLRFEDLIPPAATITRKGATSRFTMKLDGPDDWSFETRYGRLEDKSIRLDSSQQTWKRPTGWLIAGKLGVRRDKIADRWITVAAPTGSRFRRIPMLAFLQWTLPTFVDVFPSMPEKLLVVSGSDAMWRGALSGPSALYLHPDRPIISENGTSTLLHELVHVATRLSAEPGDDWIVEGLAEYYSLEILRRSKGLSERRFSASLEALTDWSQEEDATLSDPSKGADTALAALLFHEIAGELRGRDAYKANQRDPLDAAIAHLLEGRTGATKVSHKQLQTSIKETSGKRSKVLADAIEEIGSQ